MRALQIGYQLLPRAEIFSALVAGFQVFSPERLLILSQSKFNKVNGYFRVQMHLRTVPPVKKVDTDE